MTTEKIILRSLLGHEVERPPFWFMRQAGRFLPEYRKIRASVRGFLDLCYNSELAEEVTLQPVQRFDTDAAILFADILLVPHALGQDLAFLEGEGPVLDPIRNISGLDALRPEGLLEKLSPIFSTVERLARSLAPEKALIGFAGAPWTVATYMVEGRASRDYPNIKNWAYGDPAGFGKLVSLLEDATAQYLIFQANAGADALQLFDTWAGVLPADMQERWVVQPTKRIVDSVRKVHPNIPIIGFPKGIGPGLIRYANITGVSAVGLDTSMDPAWAAKYIQPICGIQGNLDPGLLSAGGDTMLASANEIIDDLKSGPHIFNLGHGIWPTTDPNHLADLVAMIRNYRYSRLD